MFAALSLLEAGYTVFANADASSTFDVRTADLANARMREASVYVMPQSSVVSDIQRDWRSPPGVAGLLTLLSLGIRTQIPTRHILDTLGVQTTSDSNVPSGCRLGTF